MRKIIFRGKRVDTGEWLYGDLVGGNYIRYYDPDNDEYDECEVIEKTVGQFIGLKDKNGKQIFEGDIICIPNHFSTNQTIAKGTIYFDEKDISYKAICNNIEYQIGVDVLSNEIEIVEDNS